MIHIFHIFQKSAQIPKVDYTPNFRKSFFQWKKRLKSEVGYVQNGKLFLPDYREEEMNVSRTGAIILKDIPGYSELEKRKSLEIEQRKWNLPDWFIQNQLKQNPEFMCFNKEDRKWFFGMFSIEKSSSGEFDLFIGLTENPFSSEPVQNNYKLCTLKKETPVEILVNSKSDFTMTGRKQRIYSEYDCIIQYWGDVSEVKFLTMNKIGIEREIPSGNCKKIDLRKMFY